MLVEILLSNASQYVGTGVSRVIEVLPLEQPMHGRKYTKYKE